MSQSVSCTVQPHSKLPSLLSPLLIMQVSPLSAVSPGGGVGEPGPIASPGLEDVFLDSGEMEIASRFYLFGCHSPVRLSWYTCGLLPLVCDDDVWPCCASREDSRLSSAGGELSTGRAQDIRGAFLRHAPQGRPLPDRWFEASSKTFAHMHCSIIETPPPPPPRRLIVKL